MGIGQASGVVAAVAALTGVQPRALDVKRVQDKLVSFGASVWRDEERKAKEEAHARACVKEYMKTRSKWITAPEILKSYQD